MFNFISNTLASLQKPETDGSIAQAAPVETAGSVAYTGSFNTASTSSSSSFCAVAQLNLDEGFKNGYQNNKYIISNIINRILHNVNLDNKLH